MKRNTILLLALLFSMLTQAQNVGVLNMKNGTKQYIRGPITFYRLDENNERAKLNNKCVLSHEERDNQDILSFTFDMSLKQSILGRFNGYTHQLYLCFDSEVDPTIESSKHAIAIGQLDEYNINNVLIGPSTAQQFISGRDIVFVSDTLTAGQTYYSRLARKIFYIEGGQEKTKVFYGETNTYKMPIYMRHSGLVPLSLCQDGVVYPSQEAWQQFATEHLAGATISNEKFANRWFQWLNDHKNEVIITESHVFDDGTINLVGNIPTTFYDWLISQEIVINHAYQIMELSKNTRVTESYGDISGNQIEYGYMRIQPIESTINCAATFDLSEAVPGIDYQLIITYAPDSIHDKKPSKIKSTLTSVNSDGSETVTKFKSPDGKLTDDISEKEQTVRTYDNIVNADKLTIESSVTVRQEIQYTKVIRLSEIRLRPMPKTARRE